MGARYSLFALLLFVLISQVLAEKYWYSFWPKNIANSHKNDNPAAGEPEDNAAFDKMLKKDAINVGSCVWKSSDSVGGATWYWTAQMERDVAHEKYGDMKFFELVVPFEDEDGTPPESPPVRRSRAHPRKVKRGEEGEVYQAYPPAPLEFLSRPEGVHKQELFGYDASAGKGVRVYVVDTGVNKDSPGWINGDDRKPDYLFAEPFSKHEEIDLDDEDGHGSCMADLAVGQWNGVAKRADLTSVQVDDFSDELRTLMSYEINLDALVKIADDFEDKGLGWGKAVLLLPFGWPDPLTSNRGKVFDKAYFTMLEALNRRGIAIVTSLSNYNGEGGCKAPPCIYGDPDNAPRYLPEIITVGEAWVDDGSYADEEDDRLSWTTIYGPGNDGKDGPDRDKGIKCLGPEGTEYDNIQQGTSVGKYFLSLTCFRANISSCFVRCWSHGLLQGFGSRSCSRPTAAFGFCLQA